MNGIGGSYIKQTENDAPVLVERTLSIAEDAELAERAEIAKVDSAPRQSPKKPKEVAHVSE
jgi:hypothetical protein